MIEKKLDQADVITESKRNSDSLTGEVDAGRSELLSTAKSEMTRIKNGGKTGITGDFGKVLFDDSMQGKIPQKSRLADLTTGSGKNGNQPDNLTNREDIEPLVSDNTSQPSSDAPTLIQGNNQAENAIRPGSLEPAPAYDINRTNGDGQAPRTDTNEADNLTRLANVRLPSADTINQTISDSPAPLTDNRQAENVTRPDDAEMAGIAKTGRVIKDAQGQVTEVDYPNGKSIKIKYDGAGTPVEIRESSGNIWLNFGPGGWNHYDNKLNQIDHVDSVKVSPNGDIIFTENNSHSITKHPDSTYTVRLPDNSKREVNSQGLVTEVDYPNGKFNKVKYDGHGNPVEIKNNDGDTWKKDATGWSQYDKNGKKGQHADNITVSSNGDITYSERNSYKLTKHNDGSFTMTKPDGSRRELDSQGHLTEVHYPDGKFNKIKSDAQGNPVEIATSSSTVWRKEANGWTQFDKDGKKMRDAADLSVDDNGDIRIINRDGSQLTKHENGTFTIGNTDGSLVDYDAQHRITKIEYPDGDSSKIKYDTNGNPVAIEDSNGSVFKREANGWNRYSKNGKLLVHADSLQISPQGDIAISQNSGNRAVKHTDGTVTD